MHSLQCKGTHAEVKEGGGGRSRDEGMEGDMEGEEGRGGGELERELLIPDWIKCRILYIWTQVWLQLT